MKIDNIFSSFDAVSSARKAISNGFWMWILDVGLRGLHETCMYFKMVFLPFSICCEGTGLFSLAIPFTTLIFKQINSSNGIHPVVVNGWTYERKTHFNIMIKAEVFNIKK